MISNKIYHACIDVRGALNWPKKRLKLLLKDAETGKRATAEQAKDFLMDCLSEGKEVIPFGECDNFDFKEGCQGHDTIKRLNK